ncbi:MAG TPA: SDR family NAD(P)-dependent oxidoreductase [Steroidobacteraceae bacterium]|nr:SDR family NAD(P)-dependent oxidoreductase [Steroidobacteraceae bacterium]
MSPGSLYPSCIVNTGSITGARGHRKLIDYSATQAAIEALSFALAQALSDKGNRVNGVAPGPVWTALIPASYPPDAVAQFGTTRCSAGPRKPAKSRRPTSSPPAAMPPS